MTTVLNQKFGAAIRQKRLELGLSQAALAERVGISFQQIQKYEKGRNQVAYPMLVRIASALNMSPAALVMAATGERSPVTDGLSDRAVLELVKRISTLAPNQREGVRLLVNQLAGGGHE